MFDLLLLQLSSPCLLSPLLPSSHRLPQSPVCLLSCHTVLKRVLKSVLPSCHPVISPSIHPSVHLGPFTWACGPLWDFWMTRAIDAYLSLWVCVCVCVCGLALKEKLSTGERHGAFMAVYFWFLLPSGDCVHWYHSKMI